MLALKFDMNGDGPRAPRGVPANRTQPTAVAILDVARRRQTPKVKARSTARVAVTLCRIWSEPGGSGTVGSLLRGMPRCRSLGSFALGGAAPRLVSGLAPDIVLLELIGFEPGSWTLLEALTVPGSPGRIVLVKQLHAFEPLQRALHLGVSAILGYEPTARELATAVAETMAGGLYLAPIVRRAYVSLPAHGRESAVPAAASLTRRELEIVRLLARGHSQKQIADALQVSACTVRNHLAMARSKLGAHNALDLVSRVRAGHLGI
jgi:DNA-binding NarL/FixJ family response regulator